MKKKRISSINSIVVIKSFAGVIMSNIESLNKFKKLQAKMLQGGGEERLKAQNDKGKLTARQRITGLVDKDSFVESQAYIYLEEPMNSEWIRKNSLVTV